MTTDTAETAAAQARLLSAALPYMQRYENKTVVVKYGGQAMGDIALGKAELTARTKSWKPPEPQFASGYLWKYAQQVGPARNGAVTHPGGAVEKACYADI